MGDPGLHSKFVEMQQEQAFEPRHRNAPVDDRRLGLMLDRSRIVRQIQIATNPNHVAILRLALAAIEQKLNAKK
jgi:hypothetical protein